VKRGLHSSVDVIYTLERGISTALEIRLKGEDISSLSDR